MEKIKENTADVKERINLEDYLKMLDFSKIDIPLKKQFISTEIWLKRGNVFPADETDSMQVDEAELAFMDFFNRVRDLKIDTNSIQRQLKVDLSKIPHRSNQILKLYGKVLRKKIFRDNLWSYDMNLLFLWTILKTASLSAKTVSEMNDSDWDIVALAFFNSDREDLKFQWQYLQKSVAKKAPWTEEEDRILADLLKDGEPKNKKWKYIAKHLYERSTRKVPRLGRHCHERWTYHLDPNLKKKCPWSQEEDDIIVEYVQKYGKRWSMISKKLSGRNENSVKIRFKRLQNMYTINVPDSNRTKTIYPEKKLPYPGLKNESPEIESENTEESPSQDQSPTHQILQSRMDYLTRLEASAPSHKDICLDSQMFPHLFTSVWNNGRPSLQLDQAKATWEVPPLHFERIKLEAPIPSASEMYQIKVEDDRSGDKSKQNPFLMTGNPFEEVLYQQSLLQEGGWFYKYPNYITSNMVQYNPLQPDLSGYGFSAGFNPNPMFSMGGMNPMRSQNNNNNNFLGRGRSSAFPIPQNYGVLPMNTRIMMPTHNDCSRSTFINYVQNVRNNQQQGLRLNLADNFFGMAPHMSPNPY